MKTLLFVLILGISGLLFAERSQQEKKADDVLRMFRRGDMVEIKKYFEAGNDVNALFGTPGWNSHTPLGFAATYGDDRLELTKYLVGNGADVNKLDGDGLTPLCRAIIQDAVGTVRFLLANGADPEPVGKTVQNDNPMRNNALLTAAQSGCPAEIVADLLAHGVKVDVEDPYWGIGSPLCYAAGTGNLDAAALLLKNGADIERSGLNRKTPFLCAAGGSRNAVEMMKLLIAHGAKPDARGLNGRTAVFYAAQYGGSDARNLDFLLSQPFDNGKKFDLEAVSDTFTPLSLAAHHGKLENIRKLLALGVDIDSAGDPGIYSPLLSCIRIGQHPAAELLIKAGADVNRVPEEKPLKLGEKCHGFVMAPIYYAIQSEKIDLVKLLVKHGARLDLKLSAWRNQTPLEYAESLKLQEIANYLREQQK